MKTVYSCSFNLASANGENAEAVFKRATQYICEWVKEKYRRSRDDKGWETPITLPDDTGKVSPIDGHAVAIERQSADGCSIFQVTWDHPDDNDQFTLWSSQLLLSRDDSHVHFALQTRLASLRYVIQPSSYVVGIPRIVRDFLKLFTCSIDGWSLPLKETVLSVGDVENYVKNKLLAVQRPIPAIVISPSVWTEKPVVSPSDWIRACAGFAEVSVLQNKWAAFRLTELVGKELSCYDGAVRIYWPGFSLDSSANDHGLWLAGYLRMRNTVCSPVERGLFRFLSAIAVTRHIESPIASRVRHALNSATQAEREAAIRAVKSHQVAKEDLERQLLGAWEEKEKLIQDLTTARTELEHQRESWAQMQTYLATQEPMETLSDTETKETTPHFESVVEAYDTAVKDFGGQGSPMHFLDSARKSAEESPYNSPELVYALLKELHELASRWRAGKGKLGQSWEDALEPTGFEYKSHISQTTESKYGDEYRFLYEGRKLLFEEHVTKGAKHAHTCFSLHLYRDTEKLRIVIGHCGKHLSNTTT